jgi:hypothetical protein
VLVFKFNVFSISSSPVVSIQALPNFASSFFSGMLLDQLPSKWMLRENYHLNLIFEITGFFSLREAIYPHWQIKTVMIMVITSLCNQMQLKRKCTNLSWT